jgi:hypothetical protein
MQMWTSAHSWQFVNVFISNLTFCRSLSYDKTSIWTLAGVPVFIYIYIEFFFPWHLRTILQRGMDKCTKEKKRESESSFHMITFWLGVRTLWTIIVKVRENEQEKDWTHYCYFESSVWLMMVGWMLLASFFPKE